MPMYAWEMEKSKIDLSKRGCIPATNFNGRWSCVYGNHGLAAVKHNYYTKRGAFISVYDIYCKAVYECSFKTKKSALGYLEARENGFKEKEQV